MIPDTTPLSPKMRPAQAQEYLSVLQVAQRYNVNRSTIWRWLKLDPSFPRPISLSPSVTRWKLSDMLEWEHARIA